MGPGAGTPPGDSGADRRGPGSPQRTELKQRRPRQKLSGKPACKPKRGFGNWRKNCGVSVGLGRHGVARRQPGTHQVGSRKRFPGDRRYEHRASEYEENHAPRPIPPVDKRDLSPLRPAHRGLPAGAPGMPAEPLDRLERDGPVGRPSCHHPQLQRGRPTAVPGRYRPTLPRHRRRH